MSTSLEEISAAFDGINEAFSASDYANMCAIGVWPDDPGDPGITVVVFQGKLYAITIPDSYTNMDPLVITDLINSGIVNAYIEWDTDRKRLMTAAQNRGNQ